MRMPSYLMAVLLSVALPLAASAAIPSAATQAAMQPATQPATQPTTAPATQKARVIPANPITFNAAVRHELNGCITQLLADGDFAKARQTLNGIFDQVIANDPMTDVTLITDVEFNRRLVGQLLTVDASNRPDLLKFLHTNDALARDLVFAIKYDPNLSAQSPDAAGDMDDAIIAGQLENPAAVYRVLQQLRQLRPGMVEKYPTLATAIAIDYKQPFRHFANENHADSNPPVDVFDYYCKNEAHMLFGLKGVPAELLIWVVDTTTPPNDLAWALNNYAGNREVGGLFFTIPYDYGYFSNGTVKALTKNGFSLPNILKYGGVCIDQAYFASEVGKAIGVPTAIAEAEGGEVGHAWVGFLEAAPDNRSARWNFDVGRYAAYKAIRGNVEDPQTRRMIPDAFVSMTAELIGSKAEDRQAAEALTDAAQHLLALEIARKPLAPPPFADDSPIAPTTLLKKPRQADSKAEAELVETGLRHFPGYVPGWLCVGELAEAGKFTLEQKRYWSNNLIRLCGNKYPDFTLAILQPMIATVADTKDQNLMWNNLYAMFQGRSDLQAEVRWSQADMWQKAGDNNNAGMCCEDIVTKFAADGPFVFDALERTEQLLRDTNRADKVLVLYASTWKSIPPPGDMFGPLKRESNWYNVGKMYARRLEEAGLTDQAATVRNQLETAVTASGK